MKYSECVFVALVIQLALNIRHIVLFALFGYTQFFHITYIILEKNLFT